MFPTEYFFETYFDAEYFPGVESSEAPPPPIVRVRYGRRLAPVVVVEERSTRIRFPRRSGVATMTHE